MLLLKRHIAVVAGLLFLLTFVFSACNGQPGSDVTSAPTVSDESTAIPGVGDTPDAPTTTASLPTTPQPTPTTTPTSTSPLISTPEPLDPVSVATRDVTFRVKVPENTPSDEQVYLLILSFLDWSWTQHVPLMNEGNGMWSGSTSVEEGALVRYVYDRWDEQTWGDPFKDTREGYGETVKIENRYLLVTSDTEEVSDVIETWNDLRAPAATGVLMGVVEDVATGEPLMDTNISIGGVHIATDYDGRFKLTGIAAGEQRVTVYRTNGDYSPTSLVADVPEGEGADLRISMDAAAPVEVTFDVMLPEDTPPEAEIKLVGSVVQAGAILVSPNYPYTGSDFRLPSLERVAPDRAVGTLTLHEGTYLQYYYSIGTSSHGQEFREGDGDALFRSLIVPAEEEAITRHEQVESWRSPGAVRVTVRVTVPSNTPADVPLAVHMGPTHWMTQTGPDEWTFYFHGFPGNELRYRYLLGASETGRDGTASLEGDGTRTIIVPESDIIVEHRIERWAFDRPVTRLADGETAEVTFRVSVPPSTSRDAPVRLIGDVPELADGIPMTALSGNPWLYQATVRLPASESLTYSYDRGDAATASEGTYSTKVEFNPHVLNDWVTHWGDDPAEAGIRPDFMNGIYMPDFWSAEFLDLSPSTFDEIVAHNGGWVAVSSVWSYEQIQPSPVVGSRAVIAPSVLTPRTELLAQARIAHEKGLKVFLGVQFNMEMSPGGGDALNEVQSSEWWDAWLEQAERHWMWNAIVAEEAGIEAMMLPGYFFHVFAGVWAYPDPDYAQEFDRRVAELIRKVRSVYSGQIMISGGVQDFNFPGLADLVGVTTYDTGHPALPSDATVDQWRDAYDALFAETVDPRFERWGVPVFFYTIHVPVMVSEDDPFGEEAQARQLEGLFQSLETRPWIAGSLSWAYSMVEAPLVEDSGVRGRLAEAVLAKYYGLYAGS